MEAHLDIWVEYPDTHKSTDIRHDTVNLDEVLMAYVKKDYSDRGILLRVVGVEIASISH